MKFFYSAILILCLLWQSGCTNIEGGDPVGKTGQLTGSGCVVLNYHRIREPNIVTDSLAKLTGNAELNVYSVYTDEFKSQIRYLKEHHVQFVTADELKAYVTGKKQIAGKCAMITFDDIDESVYKEAFPILKEEQVPFTVFMIMGHIGEEYNQLQLASKDQLLAMKKSGLAEIGLHTYDMHYLDKDGKPPFLKAGNLQRFQQDTGKAAEAYEKLFGEKPRYYAYPYGYGTPDTDLFLLQQGSQLIFSLQSGIVKPGDPSFFIKRVLLDKDSWKAVRDWAGA
ncbi:polysaccharide deacetylase family protein [Ectobacillus ponti]|uniref:Polysaccharide deacetylase family protein n=1 Tax=Ectobacillus ponti TaxID=2961894 RepID=A0AA42BS38_9BACI|nr:polysaccharide deacetylase family protein [Ectobacillus ponti]MCP8968038.1 polysaccharide deacetylase family protein [Ectobacillus ponti]